VLTRQFIKLSINVIIFTHEYIVSQFIESRSENFLFSAHTFDDKIPL